MSTHTNTASNNELVLVLGATGKTGRRIVSSLRSHGIPVRLGSRSAVPSFDWNNEAGWDACLEGVTAVYINYAPDLAMPGATDAIRAFVERAKTSRRQARGPVVGSWRRRGPGLRKDRAEQSGIMDDCPRQLVQSELLRGRVHRHGAGRRDHAACRRSGRTVR
jgi:hypothetical protein